MLAVTILAGLALLVAGGDLLVRGAVAVARRAGISPLVIGLTLVGFGTSTPELLASVQAALLGAPDIAVGNVVGSNIANVMLILGLAALISPVAATAPGVRRDLLVTALATLAVVGLLIWGEVPRWMGGALIAVLVLYTLGTLIADRRDAAMARLRAEEAGLKEAESFRPNLWAGLAFAVGGMAAVMLGARFLVTGAVELASHWGVSESVIGVTVVAIGTSLPELVTALVAAARKESDVALGNVLGSNIFNVLGILGVTALVTPIVVPDEVAQRDTWILAVSLIALAGAVLGLRQVPRALGFVLLAGYAVYLVGLAGGLPDAMAGLVQS